MAKITEISDVEVLIECRRQFGLSYVDRPFVDVHLLAMLIRNSAAIHQPCSRTTLRSSVLECLSRLPTDYDSLDDAIDEAIDALLVLGDLVEVKDVSIEDSVVQYTCIFVVSPRFVLRPSGSIFLLGTAPDHDIFLPHTLNERILRRGVARILEPHSDEDLAPSLKELGLKQIPEEDWLSGPKETEPDKLVKRYEHVLSKQSPADEIPELRILDSERNVTYYSGRWVSPSCQTGTFVARRPQHFGNPLWCLVGLQSGKPTSLVDLPLEKSNYRPCDVAWHIQSAIDYCRGAPQVYSSEYTSDGARLDFYSPIPQWAERRLMIIGKPITHGNNLFSYMIPSSEAETEEAFLQTFLWMSKN